MSDTIKYFLEEGKMPKTWYNIAADLPKPLDPVLHPGTLKPIGPDDLAPLFPMALICLLYTSPSPRDVEESRMPSSA